MAKSKGDMKYGTSQTRLNKEEAARIAYKHGTPLEGRKIAESKPVDLFRVPIKFVRVLSLLIVMTILFDNQIEDSNNQSQMRSDPADDIQTGQQSITNSAS